jgi:hypothetical protein
MRVRGGSPSRSSGGSVGDRDEPRAITELIYSAGDEKRSVREVSMMSICTADTFPKLRVDCSLIAWSLVPIGSERAPDS